MILDVNPQALFSIGADVNKEYIKIRIMDFCMNYVLRKKVERYPIENDPNAVADEICLPIESIIEESKIDRQKVISIGISAPERIIRI